MQKTTEPKSEGGIEPSSLPAPQSPVTKRLVIHDILDAEVHDPNVWNSLHHLGFAAIVQIEMEWRGTLDPAAKPDKAWYKIYQKLRRALHHTEEYKSFRREALEIYGNACCKCGGEKALQVHHKISWWSAPSLRMVLTNVEVQCASCHQKEDSSLWFTRHRRAERRQSK